MIAWCQRDHCNYLIPAKRAPGKVRSRAAAALSIFLRVSVSLSNSECNPLLFHTSNTHAHTYTYTHTHTHTNPLRISPLLVLRFFLNLLLSLLYHSTTSSTRLCLIVSELETQPHNRAQYNKTVANYLRLCEHLPTLYRTLANFFSYQTGPISIHPYADASQDCTHINQPAFWGHLLSGKLFLVIRISVPTFKRTARNDIVACQLLHTRLDNGVERRQH